MRLVILESPFGNSDFREVEKNIAYARACLRDCLLRGEAPFASHLLYTQGGVLDDNIREERTHGILAGLEWARHADAAVIYTDRGITPGMKLGIETHQSLGLSVEYRTLPGWT